MNTYLNSLRCNLRDINVLNNKNIISNIKVVIIDG